MLSSRELLERLSRKKISNARVARVLGVDDSAVTRMHKGGRRITLDEAKKICDAFALDEEEEAERRELSDPVARLLVMHAAEMLSVALAEDDPRVAELAADYRIFSRLAVDPVARASAEIVDGFFRARRLERGAPGSG